MICFDFY